MIFPSNLVWYYLIISCPRKNCLINYTRSIALKNNDTDKIVGSWSAGAWGSNKYWYVEPNIELGPGTYTIIDSDYSTWSYNSESGNRGFAYVGGVFIE